MALLLTEPGAAGDLGTYLGRAAGLQDGSVRLVASGGVLAVYAPVLSPTSLLDDGATVLALRTFAIRELAADLDVIVPASAVRSRLEAAGEEGFDPGAPTPVYAVSWAGIVPPRDGWTRSGAISASVLRDAAAAGIAEVAAAIPGTVGEAIVQAVRSRAWNVPITEAIPRGAAFAAEVLGFLPPDGVEEEAACFEVGPWHRVSLRRGHVLVKRRAWSLAG